MIPCLDLLLHSNHCVIDRVGSGSDLHDEQAARFGAATPTGSGSIHGVGHDGNDYIFMALTT